jgi:uncharacterized protein YecE (DUF72 family)
MPATDRLPWYAQHFEMVEVNSTFYSVPDPRMVERWVHATPDDFVFDVKLHQLLSRHSTAVKLLPTALQRRAEVDGKGKVVLTPEIEEAVAREFCGRWRCSAALARWARCSSNSRRRSLRGSISSRS